MNCCAWCYVECLEKRLFALVVRVEDSKRFEIFADDLIGGLKDLFYLCDWQFAVSLYGPLRDIDEADVAISALWHLAVAIDHNR